MMTETTTSLLHDYRTTREQLLALRQRNFPTGQAVLITHEQYNGYGLVVRDDGCPADCLPVKLENETVWWCPLESCEFAEREEYPGWVKQLARFEVQNARQGVVL